MLKQTGFYVLMLGIGLMLVGLYRQEAALILEKAITICLQCIGIG
jgi:hypothetical protein